MILQFSRKLLTLPSLSDAGADSFPRSPPVTGTCYCLPEGFSSPAGVLELVDNPDLGSGALRRGSSSLPTRTNATNVPKNGTLVLFLAFFPPNVPVFGTLEESTANPSRRRERRQTPRWRGARRSGRRCRSSKRRCRRRLCGRGRWRRCRCSRSWSRHKPSRHVWS